MNNGKISHISEFSHMNVIPVIVFKTTGEYDLNTVLATFKEQKLQCMFDTDGD